ncbi:MAG TPA: hypothetical protein VMD75_01820 [Candidatus Binataceae bacterium]|nr:hypothetical protein [Candidatus Binataceae bacterium]
MRKFSIPLLIAIVALVCGARNARAAQVSGVLAAPSGQIAGRQLHFENHATRDIYMAPTSNQGQFEADLPPGVYSLRGERGRIFVPRIVVFAGEEPVNLGTVNQPTGFNPFVIFQLEGVAPVLINTPAPSTAYLTSEAGPISTLLPVPPVTGAFSQKGGAGGAPVFAPVPIAPPTNSQLTPVLPR